ncbi:hypothetical protein CONPUDRAFT_64556 [Coniophora puteana RWD-64-598 SS2]|uniref:GST N-terminal domain-containing protein n=1 Tax=Coniophora puteana (strain RWD-64-598) TaxID=741705 RepID=A0A5M3MBQ5_CONPW|nr:uncharacterized protein CONPUDRAFT_64556 [Coniophora puteana RWD-64-598 SS2]EIW76250.1 hypothetical protein CONPUDRAFT_64556 [Coniophora puteana RWD-64-598 SS2]
MALPIVFYDIPSTLPNNAWSPNTWKIRYALNMKCLPYKTEWVEYPDIEPLAVKLGGAPTGTKPDGSPLYTLPMIKDPNNGKVVTDSLIIAAYLDEAYPDNVTLFPANINSLAAAFEAEVCGALDPILLLLISLSASILNPTSAKFYKSTREVIFDKKFEEFASVGAKRAEGWKKAEEGLGKIADWLATNGDSKYVLGDTASYADCILAGYMGWVTTIIPGAGLKSLENWHDGRWIKHLNAMEAFAKVQ